MIRLRLLPLTIIALALLLAQKSLLLIGAAVADAPALSPADGSPVAPPAASASNPPAIANWDSAHSPPALCPPASTLSPGELAVLSSLRQRAAALDAREEALDRKQALVDAATKNLTVQVAGLKVVEARLKALSQSQSQASETRWQTLVSTYEAMDPQAAAAIFDGLDENVLLPVLQRMNNRKSALILADMTPDKARLATEMMAGQPVNLALGALPGGQ